MIIFDLDGTLADCEHRRHFIQAPEDHCGLCYDFLIDKDKDKDFEYECLCGRKPAMWRLDCKSFYEACDKDKLIIPVAEIYDRLWLQNDYYEEFEIWSGRCKSVRKKTEKWLEKHSIRYSNLKMRQIDDNTPYEQLKERWLDEAISQGKVIDFVFDSDPASIRMWRRRGIFVFNCCQHDGEF